jgi:hypothetical protein
MILYGNGSWNMPEEVGGHMDLDSVLRFLHEEKQKLERVIASLEQLLAIQAIGSNTAVTKISFTVPPGAGEQEENRLFGGSTRGCAKTLVFGTQPAGQKMAWHRSASCIVEG